MRTAGKPAVFFFFKNMVFEKVSGKVPGAFASEVPWAYLSNIRRVENPDTGYIIRDIVEVGEYDAVQPISGNRGTERRCVWCDPRTGRAYAGFRRRARRVSIGFR